MKIYICMKCGQEVWSLICRRIDGEDWDICEKCYQDELTLCSGNMSECMACEGCE